MKKPEFQTALIIDDNPADTFLHKLVIQESHRIPHVIEIQSAREGLARLIRQDATPPVLILLDINMPDMNGFLFLEEFAKLPPPIQDDSTIVMLSTSLNADDRARAENDPHVAKYLTKPLTIAKITDIADHFPIVKTD